MLVFHDPVPELAGRTCTALLAQEYWLALDQICPANVLFLQCDSCIWHRFFIDAGVLFWRAGEGSPSLPPDSGEHRYVFTDVGQRYGIAGSEISGVQTSDLPGGGEIRLCFNSGATVALRNREDAPELQITLGINQVP